MIGHLFTPTEDLARIFYLRSPNPYKKVGPVFETDPARPLRTMFPVPRCISIFIPEFVLRRHIPIFEPLFFELSSQ